MKKFLLLTCCLLCFLISLFGGWYYGYTRAVARAERILQQDKEMIIDHFHETKDQDEFAAAIALGAFKRLQAGDLDRVQFKLLATIGIYYHAHRIDGNSNLIESIERYAATNAAVSNTINRKVE